MENYNTNKALPEEYKVLLERFFSAEDVNELSLKILHVFPDEKKIKFDLNEGDNTSLIAVSYFSIKLRQIADRAITFAEKKLERSKYLEFLLELGKLLTNQAELHLSSEIFDQVLLIVEKDKNFESVKAYTLLALGDVFSRQALWTQSLNYIKKAKSIFEKTEDKIGLGKCEILVGSIYVEQGDFKSAKIRFENCISYLSLEEDMSVTAMVEVNMGIVKYIEGDFDSAKEYFKSGLEKFSNLGNQRKIAETRQNLGMVYARRKEHDAAINEFNEAISISLDSRYLHPLCLSYLNVALIYADQNKYELAESFADKSMEISYQLNDKLSIAEIYRIKGIIRREEEDYDSSEDYLLTSLRINKDLKNAMNYAETSCELGLLYKHFSSKEKSKQYFNEALDYYKKINAKPEISRIEAYMN